jgi:tetratricopeptide (TPR) repeat protein
VEDLEVPQTLHALIAARLDGLAAEERWLLQVASVMGKTFSKPALAAVTSIPATELDTLLTSLLRKEVLQVQADPRSPERGQYGFLQDLVKRVAYETLSKKERKAKHLAVASYLQSSSSYEQDEIVEVVAAHYTEAYRAAPDAPDAEEIKEHARTMLARAGKHAASLAANEEAQHYFEQAADLAEDPATRAELLEHAGMMARNGGRSGVASDRFEQAIALFERAGQTHAAARVSARHAEVMWQTGRLADAVDRMERAFETLESEEPDEDLAMFAAQLARLLYFSGHPDRALQRLEMGLDIAEALGLPEVLSQALNTKGVVMISKGRTNECVALMEFALKIALENDLSSAALRAYYNLADQSLQADRHQDAVEQVQRGLALARKIGNRTWEWQMLGQFYPFIALGQWDEAVEMIGSIPEEGLREIRAVHGNILIGLSIIHLNRGELVEAAKVFDRLSEMEASADVQERASLDVAHGMQAWAEGRHADALQVAQQAFEGRQLLGFGSEIVKEAFVLATESALTLGDEAKAEELLTMVEAIPPGRLPPFLDAQAKRFRARLAERRGQVGQVEQLFKSATGVFRELATPFSMAATLLEHGEWLIAQGRVSEAHGLLDEARGIFTRLKATPWLERVEQATSAGQESEAVTGRV